MELHAKYMFGFRRCRSMIHFNSSGVWAFGWIVCGLCELGNKDSFVPSYNLFQRISDALEMWYRRQTNDTSSVNLYNLTALSLVVISCGKYRLFCAIMFMAVELLLLAGLTDDLRRYLNRSEDFPIFDHIKEYTMKRISCQYKIDTACVREICGNGVHRLFRYCGQIWLQNVPTREGWGPRRLA